MNLGCVGVDEELLSAFLDEATELYEGLEGKLLSLEGDVSNKDLINQIFRAFHTIKGGAGFLHLEAMVDLCHRSEDLFDLIRAGKRGFDASDMDIFSDVLDLLGEYFDSLKSGQLSVEYPTSVISALDALLKEQGVEEDDDDDLDALFESVKQNSEFADQEPHVKFEEVDEPKKPSSEVDEKSVASVSPEKKETASVRVETTKIDDIMNLVGELVLTRNRLQKVSDELDVHHLSKSISSLDHITTELQSSVMKTRMQPIKRVFQRFPRIVRDTARNLNKKAELVMFGEDTELDKNLVDSLSDPMVHMIRNSVDHGIESAEERLAKGKSDVGLVTLKAEQKGDHIEILISDDGKGLSPEFMRKKGVEKGLVSEEEVALMSDDEVLQIIFEPGFSTVDVVTNMSGRGVGMDVVKSTMEKLNGSVFIESTPDVGTTFRLCIPLTISILQTLMVNVGEQSYAIPLQATSEIFTFDDSNYNIVDGQGLVRLRDGSIPVFFMDEILPPKGPARELRSRKVVVVNQGGNPVGLVVDVVLGQEEVVIKPLGAFLSETEEFAGATITGDGKVALILDVNRLVKVG